MPELASSRKQRLRTLESQIRENYEAFVRTGFALKEIRDDELYTEDGFETWDRYLKERVGQEFGIERTQAFQLIACAQIRTKLPDFSSGTPDEKGWSQIAVVEFGRLAPQSKEHEQRRDYDRLDKRDAARVARKVIEHCEETGQKPTATIVRKFVDEDLGIDRAAKAKETKRQREDEDQERQRLQDEESAIDRRFEDLIWQMKQYTEGLHEIVAEIGEHNWKRWKVDNQILVKRLTAACSTFTGLLMED